MLSDYFGMWNQSIDIRLRGLGAKYDSLYDGDLIEDQIEMMNAWGFDAEAHHPDWISTRSIECTGELFGFINPLEALSSVAVDDSSDESICNEAEMIADNMIKHEEVDIERIEEMLLEKLTAST